MQSIILSRKVSRCTKHLEENLFVLHRELSPALLELKAMAQDICDNHLMVAIDPGTTYSLHEFSDCQLAKMGFVSKKENYYYYFGLL